MRRAMWLTLCEAIVLTDGARFGSVSRFTLYRHPDANTPILPRKACFVNGGPARKRGKNKIHRY